MARDLNKLAADIPTDTNFRRLVYRRGSLIDHELPGWEVNWKSYLRDMEPRSRKEVTGLLHRLVRKSIDTPEMFNEYDPEELLKQKIVGPRGRSFLQVVFGPLIPDEI